MNKLVRQFSRLIDKLVEWNIVSLHLITCYNDNIVCANYEFKFFEPGNLDDPFQKLLKTSITALHSNKDKFWKNIKSIDSCVLN